MEECRNSNNPRFNSVIFRRNNTQIFTNGGLWDSAMALLPQIGAVPKKTPNPQFTFPSGAKVVFGHLERYADCLSYQGSQIPLICCEESTLIRMADGTKKPLSKIQIGDMVETLQGAMPVTAIGNRRLEDCVEIENEYGEKQVHSKTHKILTSSGWVSYCDMCISCEPRQLSTSSPNVCYDVHKHAEYLQLKYQESQQLHDNQFYHQKQAVLPCQPNYQGQGLPEIFSCKVQSDQESCCELSLYDNLEPLQQLSDHHLKELQQQSSELKQDNVAHVLTCDEVQDVQNEKEFEDLRGHYLEGSNQCDAPVHVGANNVQDAVLVLDGVVVQSRKDLLSDDLDKVRKHIHHELRYVHPYTGEEQIAEGVDIEYHSCKITPLGKRWVIDLTVSTTNHYITENGLVNKNCFDELTHFDEEVFWYMFSRIRSDSGIDGYIRCTTNPDPDSWVRTFIDWWIGEDGLAIPERSGVLRWFIRINGECIWGDSRMELLKYQFDGKITEVDKSNATTDNLFILDENDSKAQTVITPGREGVLYVITDTREFYQFRDGEYFRLTAPKSVTFILSTLQDNKILMRNDPSYLANLQALPLVEQERLLGGNWNIRPAAGMYFPRSKVNLLDEVPNDVIKWVRAWDLAGTEDNKINNREDGPAYTAGVLIGERKNGRYIIADVINQRLNSSDVRSTVLNTAKADKATYGRKIRIRMNQDPGQAGKDQAEQYLKLLAGFSVNIEKESGSKETRAGELSSQWIGLKGSDKGNVDVLNAPWTQAYLTHMDGFPDRKFKDMADASSTGFLELKQMPSHSAPPKETHNTKQSYWSGR